MDPETETAPATETPASTATPPAATPSPDATATETAAAPATPPSDGDTKPEAPKTEATPATDDSDLTALSKEERVKYAEELKKLDPAARKTFNTLLTQKSQSAAEERKAAEAEKAKAASEIARLEKAHEFIQKLDADPDAALAEIQATLEKRKKPAETPKPAKVTVEPELLKAVEDSLDDQAKPLAPVIAPIIKTFLAHELKPIREHVEAEQTRAATAAAETVLTDFAKAHPDYKEHEPAMLALGKRLPKGELSDREWLDILYTHASKDKRAKAAEDAVTAAQKARADEVIQKAAKAAESAEAETPSVASQRVTHTTKHPLDFREAYEMAKRGEQVED